jgi:FixJ family two-component response regulator
MNCPIPAGASIRVLVVDDAKEDRDACRRFLGKCMLYDYILEEAESVEEGLALCFQFPPDCVLLDYRLPDGDGFDFLERMSGTAGQVPLPVVMMTGVGNEEIAVRAMKQGAMDYVVKGRVQDEAFCRTVQVAMEKSFLLKTIRKQQEEKDQLIRQLQDALDQVKTLKGIVPICACCKKIRDDRGYWQQVETYIQKHSDAEFSHGVCPDCLRQHYPEQAEKILKNLQHREIWPGREDDPDGH